MCGYYIPTVNLMGVGCVSEDVGIPSGLKELGVKEEDFPILAENTLNDACGFVNLRVASKKGIINIFKNAM